MRTMMSPSRRRYGRRDEAHRLGLARKPCGAILSTVMPVGCGCCTEWSAPPAGMFHRVMASECHRI